MTIFELTVTVLTGLIIGFVICWQAAVLSIVLSPIIMLGMYMTTTMNLGQKGGRSKDATKDEVVDDFEKSNALLSDVVINYRTVISLGQKNVDKLMLKFE